jgi:uncharacterized iron-regulated protein
MKYNPTLLFIRLLHIVLLFGLVMTLGACMKQVEHPPLDVNFLPSKGSFISKTGDQISFDEIISMSVGKEYILVGEGHKNVWDHKIQQQLFSALADSETPPSLGLEMVAVDMQPVLDDFNAGMLKIDDLAEKLQWSTKWGYSFSLFKPLFEIASEQSLPVGGLNVPTRVTRKISKEGIDALTDDEKAFLSSEIVPPSNEQLEFLDMVFAQHESKDAEDTSQRDRFRLVQSIWDSKMAEEAVALRRKYGRPVLIIAGAGHVENGWGIARRLRQFDPEAKILILMPWRGGEFYPEEGDAFFYCPDTYESRMGATLTATGRGGLLVELVKRDSRAAKAGLRPGDILVEAGGISLDHLFSLHMAGAKVHRNDDDLVFVVLRGTDKFSVNMGKLGQKKPKAHPKVEE